MKFILIFSKVLYDAGVLQFYELYDVVGGKSKGPVPHKGQEPVNAFTSDETVIY